MKTTAALTVLVQVDHVVLLALELPRELGRVQHAEGALLAVRVGVLLHRTVVRIF